MGQEYIDEEVRKGRNRGFQILALFCAIFFSAGSHFATHTINSLKSDLKSHMALDNTQYGAAQASTYLINTVMPLVGGIFMDRFGTAYGAVLASSLVLMGSILAASSTHAGSFPMLVAARILHGLGSGSIVVAQETILGRWFGRSIVGTVIGIQIGASRLFSFIAHGTSLPFSRAVGYYGASLWMAVGVCFLSWTATLLYAVVLVRAGGESRPKRAGLNVRRLLYLPTGFWLMPFTIMLLGGVWTPFLGSVAEFVKIKYGAEAEVAAWTGSASLAIPVILSPCIGAMIDRFGRRSFVVMTSSLLCIVAMSSLGYSNVSPLFGLIMFSISLTIGPVALISSVLILLPLDMIGTGIGTHKVGLSVGEALMHSIVGHIQDSTPNHTYDNVIPVFIALSTTALGLSFVYAIYNRCYLSGLFDAPISDRQDIMEAEGSKLPANCTLEELEPNKKSHKFLVSLMVFLVLACWSLFVFSLVSSPAKYLKILKLS